MFHAPRTKPGGRHKRMEIKHNTITSVLGSVTPPPRCLTLGSVGCLCHGPNPFKPPSPYFEPKKKNPKEGHFSHFG